LYSTKTFKKQTFDLKNFNHIDDFNIIPCSTIYSLPEELCPNLNLLNKTAAFIDLKARKKLILCIKSNSVASFLNFLDLL